MLAYVKALVSGAARRMRDEVGQNIVETALIIGVVSLVLVLGFMGTGVLAAVQDVGKSVVCEAQGGSWASGKGTATGTCS